jgi:hypothetical protein
MEDATRVKIAALATALFIGLLTAGGLAERPHHASDATAVAPAQSVQPSSVQPSSVRGDADDAVDAPEANFVEADDE